MSQSLASAKKRRAPIQQPEPIPTSTSTPSQNQPGLTLPQVIHIIDKRLTALEQFTREHQSQIQYDESSNGIQQDVPTNMKELVEEFDKRYDMLAEEIVNLKNIVLSLQSYTMEVNKTLMEERGRIYDEIEKNQHNE
jgi:hypothetical protein